MKIGNWGESEITKFLENRNFTILEADTRKPYDILAEKNGVKFYIQVKTTMRNSFKLTRNQLVQLLIEARGSIAVLCFVDSHKGLYFFSNAPSHTWKAAFDGEGNELFRDYNKDYTILVSPRKITMKILRKKPSLAV